MPEIPHYDLGEHYRGDTWKLPLVRFPVSIDLAGKIARMQFRRKASREAELGESLASDGTEAILTIDLVEREVACIPFVPELGRGLWHCDFQLLDPARPDPRGKPHTRTYYTASLRITDDTTE